MQMEMEIDTPWEPEITGTKIKGEDLFRAAETGDLAVFRNLSQEQFLTASTLRNEDDRSLIHVAASSGHAEVCLVSLFGCQQNF